MIGTASGLGCSVVSSLLLCIVGGVLLDRWLGTLPIFTLVGVVLGLGAAGYLFWQLATMSRPAQRLTRHRDHDGIERESELDE